ncbi:MAG: hypothetical protein RMN51_08125 [Verrucomicrobiota bacterium]|nr:hypothetical protein [Limisphaera sp.]MDW8382055.1 hypothetical protein [Verrucomicrobiota bacterium]
MSSVSVSYPLPESVWLCFALPEEMRLRRSWLRRRPDVHVLVTGVGPEPARRALETQLELVRPRAVLSCGFAGALDPNLSVGTVLFATEDCNWRDRFLQAGARPARFLTLPRMVTSASEKSQLWQSSRADAVEMESEPIAALCCGRKIPFAVVRVISDAASESLPVNFARWLGPDGHLNRAAFLRAVMVRPTFWPSVVKLACRARRAARRLAEVLAAALSNESGADSLAET